MATEVEIPRPVIEPVFGDIAAGTATLRIYRTATSLMNSPGGYRIFRSHSRSGFAGDLGDADAGYEVEGETLTQAATGTISSTQTVAGLPTDKNIYFRVQGENDLGSPAVYSRWSNVIWWKNENSRQQAVPAWPAEMRPNKGILKGWLEALQDSDYDAGVTWYEFRLVMAASAEVIYEELLQSHSDARAADFFRDPPADLRRWFEHDVALNLLTVMAEAPRNEEKLRETWLEERNRHRDEFVRDRLQQIPGGVAAQGGIGGRLVR